MSVRKLTLVAALLAATAGASQAAPCDSEVGCPPDPIELQSDTAAPAQPAAPVSLDKFRKKSEPKKPIADTSHKAAPRTAAGPQPKPSSGSLPADVYAMDPAVAPAPADDQAAEHHDVQVVDAAVFNEIDGSADAVKVVSADEVNEIDLASATSSATTGQAVSEPPPPAAEASHAPAPAPLPTSWIVGLVIAFGGTVTAASTLIVRRTRA